MDPNQNQPYPNQFSNSQPVGGGGQQPVSSMAAAQPVGQFEEIVARLRTANNVLVTVSNNPSVDQLSACIGMTVVLNKMGKHATAVFSGSIPSTIDFLQPDKTIEKNTDSLRDFIIALDKSKADKLRYKVEDEVVKIFITPYKTSIGQDDLQFSQGDFNVDAVLALGVHDRVQLDQAILAHGRILHDATVMSLNTNGGSQLGSVAWVEPNASSLCEMVGDVARDLSPNVFDAQISTALLTGIVAETDRFSNQKASPHTMSIAGVLMAAGASTQLVSTKLEEAKKEELPELADSSDDENAKSENDNSDGGTLKIEHDSDEELKKESKPAVEDTDNVPNVEGAVFEEPKKSDESPEPQQKNEKEDGDEAQRLIFEPPRFSGQLTANSVPEHKQYSDSTDPLSKADDKKAPILNRKKDDIADGQTLSEIEESVDSPHLHQQEEQERQAAEENSVPPPPPVDNARDAVDEAAAKSDYQPEAVESLGAQRVDLDLGNEQENGNESKEEPKKSQTPPPVPPPMMPPV